MRPEEYRHLYELEEHHWWFVGMRRIIAALLDGVTPAGEMDILDAGCGTGFMLGWLRRYGTHPRVVGLDYDRQAVRYSSGRGEKLVVQGTIASLPFPGESYDLVASLDVIDSFTATEAPLPFSELSRVTKNGGLILVRVPAFQFIYSQHDKAVFTRHRYRSDELCARLREQGLHVERATYAISILFPFAVIWRWLTRSSRQDPQSDVRPLPKGLGWLNAVLAGLVTCEAFWLRHLPWRLPFGLSLIVLARKPARGI